MAVPFRLSVLLASFLLLATHAFGANEVANREELRSRYGLTRYGHPSGLDDLKIAILDNGFAGFEPGKGLLPESAELINGPINVFAPTSHGLGMAQIVWAMTGQKEEGPKFYLVNSNGFSNLKAAIDFAIDHEVDIVLYSQVWTFGSNFDGTGFINAAVERAKDAGILWINAAGNYGGLAYNGKVKRQTQSDGKLEFNGRDYLRFENNLDDNEATITLSWSDFKESETYNTPKDLNLYVYDDSDRLVGASELVQRGEAPDPNDANSKLSSHAREVVTLRGLERGSYRVRITAASSNFASSDRFRVLVRSEKPGAIEFTDASHDGEIMPPADSENVITVGEKSTMSSVGPTADGRAKPEVVLEETGVAFTNGSQTQGSSNAAAIFTGIVATLKSARSGIDFDWVKRYSEQLRSRTNLAGFVPADLRMVHPIVLRNVPQGGQVLIHQFNGRLLVACPGDPLELPLFRNVGARRANPDDLLVADFVNDRWNAVPRMNEGLIRAPLVEFRQYSQGLWVTP